jgi:hypothetical protein
VRTSSLITAARKEKKIALLLCLLLSPESPDNSRMSRRGKEQKPDLWMIDKLQYAYATASDLLCYGQQELKSAAIAGAIDTLLIGGDAWLTGTEDDGVVSLVRCHGGRIVRAYGPNEALDLLGVCALLRFPMPEQSDENETAAVQEQEETGSSVELPSPPSVARTLTFFSPCGAPVHPIGDAIPAGAADELELLVAMFGADRKLRMCEPFDGSHFLLQCDAIEHDASYVILEIILPSCYPECSPLITAPYGVLPGGRTFTSEQMEACAKQCLDCARELADDSTPALCPIFDAARDWLAATADAAAIT